ncbi:MAG TPA: glucoamylase family protein [Clostridia bacterium]|nr:glucoamylase family protein [Clostridia bacterium]
MLLQNRTYFGLLDVPLNAQAMETHAAEIAALRTRTARQKEIAAFPQIGTDRRMLRALYKLSLERYEKAKELPPAAESLRDEFYIVEKNIIAVRNGLDEIMEARLPVCAQGEYVGLPHVYRIAAAMVGHREGRVEEALLTGFLNAFQGVRPLSMRELWLMPSMLRIALIKLLALEAASAYDAIEQYDRAQTALELLLKEQPEQKREATFEKLALAKNPACADSLICRLEERDEYAVLETLTNCLCREDADAETLMTRNRSLLSAAAVRVNNAIASLRFLDGLDWPSRFESYSIVERVLREEKGYAEMDAATRAYYRTSAERAARRLNVAETVVARTAVRLAENREGKRAQAGYYLFGEGQTELFSSLRPDMLYKGLTQKTRLTLFTLLEAALTVLLALFCMPLGAAGVLLSLTPAWSLARCAAVFVFSRTVPVRRIPRMDMRAGVGEEHKTLVVVPTLITDEGSIRSGMEQLETHYLSNPYENCFFAILGDFKDGNAEENEGEEELLKLARSMTAALNEKYAKGAPLFFYLHRRREWNPHDGVFMGRERKRGALMDLSNLILDGNGEPFILISDPLPNDLRYCLTLDADTLLPREALLELIGAMAHPLNRPVADRYGVIREGYGVIAPRMRSLASGAAKTRFARLISGDFGLDAYSAAAGEFYQDVFGEGVFGGKGIFDIEAFRNTLTYWIPDNAVLSHDLLEGCFLRAGFMGDVALYDSEPSSFVSWWKRQHRWFRGDWQLIAFRSRRLKDASGTKLENPLSALSRRKMTGNMAKSLVMPAVFLALLCTPFTGFGLYTVLALLALLDGLLIDFIVLVCSIFGKKGQGDPSGALREQAMPLARAALTLAILPYAAYKSLDAVIRTLYRVCRSHKNLLEWQTAAQSAAQKLDSLKSYYQTLWLCPAFGAAFLAFVFFSRAPLFCMLFGAIFLTAPYIVMRLDRPYEAEGLNEEGSAFLTEAARATWRYFETFCDEQSAYLPPDNFQSAPWKTPVRNTSPTNIGMGMLACVSAYDFGFIDARELLKRLSNMLASVEVLEKWNGHLYNWYDLTNKSVLSPRYVSTVDSGNLAACLLTAEQALNALEMEDAKPLAARCRALATGMDFTALYDRQRSLFHIGYDASNGVLSKSWYDLLASEARLTSLMAIALGQIENKHWQNLGRLLTVAPGGRALLSWGGTMFEYLMPVLFTGSIPFTLLDESCAHAVATQRAYAESMPWGISESGYFAFDRSMYYQYRAFGVPALGLQAERERERVVAPYASVLALMVKPKAAASNLLRLKEMGAFGEYGFFEAVDYTENRLRADEAFTLVKSFMAHHQGMSLCAMNNVLNGNKLQKRFLGIPEIRATRVLLEERRPSMAITIREYKSGVYREDGGYREEKPRVRTVRGGGQIPETQMLTNGQYTVFLCDSSLSFSRCNGVMLTRWRNDVLRSDSGVHVAVRDGKNAWAVAAIPSGPKDGELKTVLEPHKVSFTREENEVKANLEVCVSPQRNAEVRRLTLTNASKEAREIEVGIFAEVCLEPQRRDMAHPGFGKLTVNAMLEDDVLLFEKRASEKKDFRYLYCMLLGPSKARWCTDRLVMPGRGKSILEAMEQPLIGKESVELPVEPGICARATAQVKEGGAARFYFVMGYAPTKKQALIDAQEMKTELDASFDLAWAHANSALRFASLTRGKAELFERMAAKILLGLPQKRAFEPPECCGTERIWHFGVSGDDPIVLFSVNKLTQARTVKTLVEFHEYMRQRGLIFDLVLIGEYPHEYHNELRSRLEDMLHALCRDTSGVHLIHGFSLPASDRRLLQALCTVEIEGERSLDRQFAPQSEHRVQYRTYKLHAGSRGAFAEKRGELMFFNGLGGFDTAKNEYVTVLKNGEHTPLPWSHILANEHFGTLLTETGGGYTWCENSRECKLTQWYNEPLRDPKGEILLLTDEDDGATWAVTAGKLQHEAECAVRYGFGYAIYESAAQELTQELTVFVDPEKPVKYALLKLRNPMLCERNLRVLYCTDWVLGDMPHPEAVYVHGEDSLSLAKNCRADKDTYAYIAVCGEKCEHSADRFLVLNGGWDAERFEENTATRAGGFSALRACVNLKGGEEKTLLLIMGHDSLENARSMAQCTVSEAEERLERMKEIWKERLLAVQVKTPDAAFNTMLNGWLLYQTWAARILARTGYYQCGGAIGFRDQLQDMLSLLNTDQKRVREHLLLAASKQFEAGDVLHWWHAPSRGVRTRISDDKLFLPFVLMEYMEAAGDESILGESASYLSDQPIPEGCKDLYDDMPPSGTSGTMYEHCVRALESALTFGAHGLPLMGGGDWNDGMDLVGHDGGESVWLGFFLLHILERFAPVCEKQGDKKRAKRYEETAKELRGNLETHGWDGGWYRRAYFSDGTPLGSRENEQCSIDCVSQSWAAICSMQNARAAIDAASGMLLDEENGVYKLLAPPFNHPERQVGYISAYLPGVRENGGQYTHAAAWAVLAACKLHDPALANRIFRLLNPVEHGNGEMQRRRYKAEPYVVAGDVYAAGRIAGRAGWTWYTGAASWLYVAGLEHMLGVKRRGDALLISPCTIWEEYSFTYRFKSAEYFVTVRLKDRGEAEARIPLVDDGKRHEEVVEVRK